MTVQSLVVNKRTLPVFLRNNVPPLIVKGTAASQLITVSSRLWGALHSDVGKRIKHGNQIAVITNVHETLRQIELEDERLWIPRRAEDRRDFKESRRRRLSAAKTVFTPPAWVGTPRPSGLVTLKWVTDEFDQPTVNLLLECGHSPLWLDLRPFASGGMSDYEKEQHELQQKEQRKRALLTALNSSKSRMSTAMSNGVFDVLIDGTKLGQAAANRGLNPRSLSMTVMRVTQRLQAMPKAA